MPADQVEDATADFDFVVVESALRGIDRQRSVGAPARVVGLRVFRVRRTEQVYGHPFNEFGEVDLGGVAHASASALSAAIQQIRSPAASSIWRRCARWNSIK